MIKIYIDCSSCGFKGFTYEDEDLTDDEELLAEEEQEECPKCGEYVEEIDDDEIMEAMDNEAQQRREERHQGVIPFSLGEETDGE